ncbi:hypothetical protein [Methylophilus sp. Leaf408]|uniref:hypothetical protein n=1 Tax=Methylophilus sp. Leaf408 TaxID=2876561 RepID=UPI001E34D04E|nr:hypothetical protein [Methylophilus sp. Leaf408]
MKGFCLCIACILLLSSCETSLKSTSLIPFKYAENQQNNSSGSGLIYKLPTKRFTLTVDGEITDCKTLDNGNYNLITKVNTNLTSSLEGDDSQVYLLDYQALKSKTKTQELAVTMGNNNFISSINSKVTDQTGPIITNVATAIFSLAQSTIIPNVLPGPTYYNAKGVISMGKVVSNCPGFIVKKLAEIKQLESHVSDIQANQKNKTEYSNKITNVEQEIIAIEATLKFYKHLLNPKLRTENERRLASKLVEKSHLNAKLTNINDSLKDTDMNGELGKLASAKAYLTFKISQSTLPSLKITSDPSSEINLTLDKDPAFFQRALNADKDILVHCSNCPNFKLAFRRVAQVETAPEPKKIAGNFGIAYRVPANVEVELSVKRENETLVLSNSIVPIPQFGHIATLDLTNRVFEDTNLQVSFDDNGSITKLNFNSNAQALAASATAKDVFSGYLNFVKENEKIKVDAKKQGLDLGKADIDLAKAQSELSLINSNNELTTSNNSLKLLKNVLDLQASQAGTGGTDYEKINKLQRDNELLNLMIENAKKQKELQDIQKTLVVTP